jgi:hypothetical protein
VNATPYDWLKLALAVLISGAAIVGIALMMNLTGDCAPGVENCGETARHLSWVVLAVGAAWLIYVVVRFIRDHRA